MGLIFGDAASRCIWIGGSTASLEIYCDGKFVTPDGIANARDTISQLDMNLLLMMLWYVDITNSYHQLG